MADERIFLSRDQFNQVAELVRAAKLSPRGGGIADRGFTRGGGGACYIGVTRSGGIPKRVGATPGKALVDIKVLAGDDLVDAGLALEVRNLARTDVEGNIYIEISWKSGGLFCDWEDCP